MKIWILRPKPEIVDNPKDTVNPWQPWYDKCFGMVIVAETESEARILASGRAADEEGTAWMDATLSDCTEIPIDESGVILCDVHEA